MSERIARIFAGFLVIVHVGLGLWALVGFLELAFENVLWERLSNPLFSKPMLLLQWSLIAIAATVFVTGYLRSCHHTPLAMLAIYSAMALVCAYQTFYILTHANKYRAMAIEYAEYLAILAFLFFAKPMQRRFSKTSED